MVGELYTRNCLEYKSTNLSDVVNVNSIDTIYCTFNEVSNNFKHFLNIINKLLERNIHEINVDSYETAKYINNHLPFIINLDVHIIDDFQNKMRNYDMNVFDKINVSIPISQVLWGVDFDQICYVNLVSHANNAMSYNGNTKISKSDLIKIQEIIKSLSNTKLSDLEKIIIVSNYLQSNVEYISCVMDTDSVKHTFDKEVNIKDLESRAGQVETVLLEKFGLCTGISSATTLLLNNPEININSRNIASSNHMWNIVKLNGIFYQVDNTFCITRSPKEIKKAIKPLRFNGKYLMFGLDYLDCLSNHEVKTDVIGIMSSKSLRKKQIDENISKLSKTYNFTYSEENVVYPLTKHLK